MGFLFGKNKKEKLIVIFDIGSDSVGGAIVKIKNNQEIPEIVKSIRSEILFSQDVDLDVLLKNMIKSLSEVAKSLHDSKMGSIKDIFCVMASPWYLSENRLVKMSKEHSFVFTEKIANDLIHKEIINITENYKKEYSNKDNNLELMEYHVMNVSLNGYDIDSPVGVKTRSVEMNMMASLSSKSCLDEIRKTLSKIFHGVPISFSSFMMSSYLAVRDKYISPDSYLILDIGGEITEVGIVSKGVLMSSLSFPFGKKNFYRYMCTKLDLELRDAKELLNLYITGSLSEKRKASTAPLFLSIEKSWGEAFRQCVNALPHTLALPNVIFLIADPDIKPWFAETIKKEEYVSSFSTKYTPEVVTLNGSEFMNMCSVTNNPCDPFLMIEAIAYSRKKETYK